MITPTLIIANIELIIIDITAILFTSAFIFDIYIDNETKNFYYQMQGVSPLPKP